MWGEGEVRRRSDQLAKYGTRIWLNADVLRGELGKGRPTIAGASGEAVRMGVVALLP